MGRTAAGTALRRRLRHGGRLRHLTARRRVEPRGRRDRAARPGGPRADRSRRRRAPRSLAAAAVQRPCRPLLRCARRRPPAVRLLLRGHPALGRGGAAARVLRRPARRAVDLADARPAARRGHRRRRESSRSRGSCSCSTWSTGPGSTRSACCGAWSPRAGWRPTTSSPTAPRTRSRRWSARGPGWPSALWCSAPARSSGPSRGGRRQGRRPRGPVDQLAGAGSRPGPARGGVRLRDRDRRGPAAGLAAQLVRRAQRGAVRGGRRLAGARAAPGPLQLAGGVVVLAGIVLVRLGGREAAGTRPGAGRSASG